MGFQLHSEEPKNFQFFLIKIYNNYIKNRLFQWNGCVHRRWWILFWQFVGSYGCFVQNWSIFGVFPRFFKSFIFWRRFVKIAPITVSEMNDEILKVKNKLTFDEDEIVLVIGHLEIFLFRFKFFGYIWLYKKNFSFDLNFYVLFQTLLKSFMIMVPVWGQRCVFLEQSCFQVAKYAIINSPLK